MPRTPAPLPHGLGDAFATKNALARGATRRRLRARDLEAPFHGARRPRRTAPLHPADDEPFARDRAQRDETIRRARAYAAVMPDGAFFAGRTALALRGLPVTTGPELEVAVFSPRRAPRGRGIRGRRIDPKLAHVELVEGLPTTTVASAWAMLGGELSVRELIILGDAIVHVPRNRAGTLQPERAFATIEQLARAIDAGIRRGAPKLRAALPRIRVGSASPVETEFRLDAEEAGFPAPLLDVEVFDARGRRIGITEVVFPDQKVAVEVEGDHHRSDPAQWERDLEKYAAYADAGIEPVRVSGKQVRRRTAVERVRRALIRRGWKP
ncbi:hypothetical protein [Microbacterium sp.]|uniref:hypothetical protein n=1 Tax=Microbacterium sp. TaxID=51671 RepID=UPI003C70A0AE